MSIIINIKPEFEAELPRQAAVHGIDLEPYPATILEEAAHVGAASKKLSPDQLDRTLQELAQLSHKIPFCPMRHSRAKVCIGIMIDAGG